MGLRFARERQWYPSSTEKPGRKKSGYSYVHAYTARVVTSADRIDPGQSLTMRMER